ncbi:MAG: hypothetical protein Q9208_007630 [Pyrenodesmia sp. 3 TL-2023]
MADRSNVTRSAPSGINGATQDDIDDFANRTVERAADSSKSSIPSSADSICKADIDGELSVLELIKGTRTIRLRSHSHLEGLGPVRQPETPEHPANTLLLFQESEEQDWQKDDRQEPTEWADHGLLNVRSTKLLFCRSHHSSPETAELFRNIPVSIGRFSPAILDSSDRPGDSILSTVRPDHAAFVLFTSGSTGKPKGILQDRRENCRWLAPSNVPSDRAHHVQGISGEHAA